MAFEIPKQIYSGAIKTVSIGKGDKVITLGGETSYPFYVFEGVMPNKPRVAMEVWDKNPGEEVKGPSAGQHSGPRSSPAVAEGKSESFDDFPEALNEEDDDLPF